MHQIYLRHFAVLHSVAAVSGGRLCVGSSHCIETVKNVRLNRAMHTCGICKLRVICLTASSASCLRSHFAGDRSVEVPDDPLAVVRASLTVSVRCSADMVGV